MNTCILHNGIHHVDSIFTVMYESLLQDQDLTSGIQNVSIEFHGLKTFTGTRPWFSMSAVQHTMHLAFMDGYTSQDFFGVEEGMLNLIPTSIIIAGKQIIKVSVDDKTSNSLDIAVQANAKIKVAGLLEGQANAEVKVHKDRAPDTKSNDIFGLTPITWTQTTLFILFRKIPRLYSHFSDYELTFYLERIKFLWR
jgi:hypothetical protein